MTLHVQLSEIESKIAQSLNSGLGRVVSVSDQHALMLRIKHMYEMIALLDTVAADARGVLETNGDVDGAVLRLQHLHVITRAFFTNPKFTESELNAGDEPEQAPAAAPAKNFRPPATATDNGNVVDFSARFAARHPATADVGAVTQTTHAP